MKLSRERKERFLDGLGRGLPPEVAARAIDVDRRTVYRWRAADAEFAAEWDGTKDRRVELVDSAMFKAALNGDVTAQIFFLKSHRPEVYNRRQIVSIGGDPDAPPIGVVHAGVGMGSNPAVHFYYPANNRHLPEPDPTIEGEAGRDDEAA